MITPKRSLALVAAAIAIVTLLSTSAMLRRGSDAPKAKDHSLQRDTSDLQSAPSQDTSAETGPKSKSAASASDCFTEIAGQLATSIDREANRRRLSELRAFLDTLPRETASREVQSYLSTGNDAATQLDLTVKAGGALGDASSLRVFLLDYLGQVDRPAAGVLARQILSAPTSPDEWAVSLRNVAWSDDSPATTQYLRGKAAELLANGAWRQNPSAGYLEAFDIVVHTHATEVAPQLTALIRDKENKAVAHAAYLALDRLTIADPAATFQELVDRPELMSGREQTRANYFARADVRDPEQKALLEQYLLDPSRTAQELQTFAGIYPNANFMISNNLLTNTSTPAQRHIFARDQAALTVLDGWLGERRFDSIRPHLEQMRTRLRTFVDQAENTARSRPSQ